MRQSKPKIHAWAYPYGHYSDPWPGDLARCTGWFYRFDGQFWRMVR